MKPPRDVRSRFVTMPYTLQAPKVSAHTKKVDTIEALVYMRKTAESVAPFKTE